ncbi:hypothetical protein DO97_11950 [Neosynechococcus sphagnicola sy1]|uniref:Uncharacterized protein n=1 Tax=Neosynechococcus sphagnicola sy1 TaxID=1497020 RepID=A0A098TJ94_9CYAN|nr:hypothetical protein DO97_11950 [Neosynechococcus sphagnicola sy1]
MVLIVEIYELSVAFHTILDYEPLSMIDPQAEIGDPRLSEAVLPQPRKHGINRGSSKNRNQVGKTESPI